MANVQVRGTEVNAKPEVKEGEYVILYAGFAIQVLDENEAIQNYKNGGDSKVKFRVDLG